MGNQIPVANPKAGVLRHQVEFEAAVRRTLENGRYVLGNEVQAFEAEFATYSDASYGIGVGSGTEALHVALRACDVGVGDEVITVAHTAVATVAAIELCGATPVFVDITPDSFTLDPQQLEAAISERTKAIIPVHIYGQPADLSAICAIAKEHGLRVIEDCAQAHGAYYRGRRVGSWGDMGCFSFYPTKNLGAIGDGGMVITNDASLAERSRLLREYGWAERYVSHIAGWNSRLDELQAAFLRIKLRHLEEDNNRRVWLAERYREGLVETKLDLPEVQPDTSHVFHLFVVRTTQREQLQTYLADHGIGTLVHYPVPIHLQPAYHRNLVGSEHLFETERAAREVLSLPLYPELETDRLEFVINVLQSFDWERI